ncbi:hypothetical protein CAL7716_059620 [Calothrix sp. PCC 7716]|nr:hypothetical protein CAL7716_059620 [Calothrix sp. PCC 7716]
MTIINQGLSQKLLFCSFFVLINTSVNAQITPDNTLRGETSKVTPNILINGASADLIGGGALRGNNLFHSFTEFNIRDGQSVYFAESSGVTNILTRVTGGNASNILGTLGVDGAANLFLINPNGILFGKNASLDVRGSFVGTTANGVQFGNQGNFSATNPEAPGLLTINPSALLFNQINPNAGIVNSSVAPAGKDPAGFNAFGLRVRDGKSLLLVGGNVSISGGELNASGGRVELGGLAEAGNINLFFDENNLRLGFPENINRTSISLTNQARVYVEASGGGDITINARNIEILEGSSLSAGIGQGLGTGDAGNITMNATDAVSLVNANIFTTVQSGGVGKGGDININAATFSLQEGAQLSASTYGIGNAGNVTVNATGAVQIADNAAIFSTVEAGGQGKGGNININAETFSLQNGSQLITAVLGASNTQPAGRGDAGDINLKVTGFVNIGGTKNNLYSGILSRVETGAEGNGGNITIDAGSVNSQDGAQISAGSRGIGNGGNVTISATGAVSLINTDIISRIGAGGQGKGGNININAARLSLQDSTQLQTAIFSASNTQEAGRGDAGNVNIKVTGEVDIAGVKNGFSTGIFSRVETGTEGNGGNITIDAGSFKLRDGALLDASTATNYNGGNITINTNIFEALTGGQITITSGDFGRAGKITVNATDKVLISTNDPNYNDRVANFPDTTGNIGASSGFFVNSVGSGTGDIEINSPKITLDNQGKLQANSASGNGGNIKLNSGLLLLLRGAQISTNAGTEELGGDGGNIDIDSRFIVAVPKENSDVTANAFTGRGGNVFIRAQGIFGIEPRAVESLQTSDITASSELGVPGQISITQPDVQPQQGLIELPEEIVDATRQVAQICPKFPGAKPLGEFTITGRGSLPPSPLEPLPGERVNGVGLHLVELTNPKSAANTTKLATLDNNNTNVLNIVSNKVQNAIIEAQGWVKSDDGSLELVATAPNTTLIRRVITSTCPIKHLNKN